VVVHGRGPRPSGRATDGQHFLRSARLASELIEQIGVTSRDLVVEIGAGAGALTDPIIRRARHVVAIDIDAACVAFLRQRYAEDPRIDIVHGNALRTPLPNEPFRVIGNLPFGSGTRILRRLLDDPRTPLRRVDVLLQFEAARKRAQPAPSTLATLRWSPWWTFNVARHVSRHAFEPPPSVDAGLLTIERRQPALLRARDRAGYLRLIAGGFAHVDRPIRDAVGPRMRDWSAFAEERGISNDATAAALDAFDWAALFDRVRRRA
jgi:23S rRNA (adenine-N6)-dimethyltransferase